jgi:hypothetical protein
MPRAALACQVAVMPTVNDILPTRLAYSDRAA